MEPTFEIAFERLIGHEGKFTNDTKDRGNWTSGVIGKGTCKGTKFGISAMTYPDLDIKNLTLDQAKDIYKRDWWDKLNANQIHASIVFQVWDFAINSGMGTAKRKLQQAVGVTDDGNIGPATVKAIQAMNHKDIILKLNALRLQYLTNLSTFSTYGAGWVNRVSKQMQYGAND